MQPAEAIGSGSQSGTAPLLDQAALGSNVGVASQPAESDRKLAFLNGPVDRRTTSADRVEGRGLGAGPAEILRNRVSIYATTSSTGRVST